MKSKSAKNKVKNTSMPKDPFSDIDPDIAKKFPNLGRLRQKVQSNAIERQQLRDRSLGQMSKARILGSIPRKKTNDKFFVRVTDKVEVELAGTSKYGLPSGRTTRLILAYIDTLIAMNALINGRIYLGRSDRDVTKALGFINQKTKKPASGKIVGEIYVAISALANSTFYVRYINNGRRGCPEKVSIIRDARIPDFECRFDSKSGEYFIEIDERYIKFIEIDRAPIDIVYYCSLKTSKLMDYYCYFNHVLYGLRQRPKVPMEIKKSALVAALGPVPADGINSKQMQTLESEAIKDILEFLDTAKKDQYPFKHLDFSYNQEEDLLIIRKGLPHTPTRQEINSKEYQGKIKFLTNTTAN